MKFLLTFLTLCLALFQAQAQDLPITKRSFDSINLGYAGLENVHALYDAGNYRAAAEELLRYYRKHDDVKPSRDKPDAASQLRADNALAHKFQPQKGYGFFDYGKEIDWTYWPVKDNEVRWQLHRLRWWLDMAQAYRSSGDEKYASEWVYQFRDWTRKNQLGQSAQNDRFAWRPLEASERISLLQTVFHSFVTSPSVSPSFLLEFLNSASFNTEFVRTHYSESGNHRLFEAQRVLGMGAALPELKLAGAWRQSGIGVLNREIVKQVYPDGVQWELSPIYHAAMIDVFIDAYDAAHLAGLDSEFPPSYLKTVEKMIDATANMSFPDDTTPMFGDSWLVTKEDRVKHFQHWSALFPENSLIRFFAHGGAAPLALSHALKDAGFYTFRNGWDDRSIVMQLKASPPGEFHAQPDNGTFELWVKGRNFMPDSGCYIYSGDAKVMAQRDWYRQTRVHDTLTLDNRNMVVTKAVRQQWETSDKLDLLRFTNPSYPGLDHQRTVQFIDKKFFVITDRASGPATGLLGVHFQLKEDSKPVIDKQKNKVFTTYADGNNLLIQALGPVNTEVEDGKVSYVYNHEMARPAFVFEQEKPDTITKQFMTVLYPFDGTTPPGISVKEKASGALIISVNGKEFTVQNVDYTSLIR
jgi:heparan-sulfate lyase